MAWKSNGTAGTAALTPKWRAAAPTCCCGIRGAALLSILGVIYPMRSTVEMARLVHEHDGGWSHRFQSDLVRIEQYAECGCELVVTEPLTNLPELWEDLEADREALWRRILDLSGYDLNDAGTTR